jgi:predicted dehydrogenase
MSKGPVRLAVVGGRRGFGYTRCVPYFPEGVKLVTICDTNPQVLSRWKEAFPQIETLTSFDGVVHSPTIDAVLLATPLMLHVEQSVELMENGKHVLCEVPAAHTIEGCWQLVETVEKTGVVFMLAENFCYSRNNMLVRNMAAEGAFGPITHAECGYIHDVRGATHTPDGQLTWRGELLRDFNGVNYPTHSLGPVSQWLGINRGDSFDFLISIASRPLSQASYFGDVFGPQHPGADPAFWRQGDSCLTLIQTKQGVVIYLRNDFSSARPWNYLHYGLQGTKGAMVSGRDIREAPLVWFETQGPRESPGGQARWSPLSDHARQYEHPWWKAEGEKAQSVGPFGDYFILKEFITAIREERAPDIDVYDAVAISSVFPLSVESIAEGNQPVRFPDFGKNK